MHYCQKVYKNYISDWYLSYFLSSVCRLERKRLNEVADLARNIYTSVRARQYTMPHHFSRVKLYLIWMMHIYIIDD